MSRPQLMRGAFPSPRHELAAAEPHKVVSTAPPQFLWKPKQLAMWGNKYYGDCCSAEEAFAKSCYSSEIFISSNEVVNWAYKNGVLGGATLTQVMKLMAKSGFIQSGETYNDGPYKSVDWEDATLLENAIAQGPVKIGISADALLPLVIAHPASGWFATGFRKVTDYDHCTSLCGYGTFAWLATQFGVTVPEKLDPTTPGYGLFTWSSIGIIDVPSMLAITGEAWLRNPVTIIKS